MTRRTAVADGETVSTGSGFGGGLVLAILAIVVLALLFFGWQGNWFGVRSGPGVQNNPTVTSPMPSGGGGESSPSSQPSPS